MSKANNRWACPYCHTTLEGSVCPACSRVFTSTDQQLDFRPTASVELLHRWDYNTEFGRFDWAKARLDWPDVGNNLSYLPEMEPVERNMLKSVQRGSGMALDIGCGERRQRFKSGLVELGYDALGIDVAGRAPDALADAHLLPLADASIDLLMSSAVWEHLKHPHHAMSEAARVAKPGAVFVGSVAFSEPFHISYFHHSPLALYELLESTGFDVEYVVISDEYSAFFAHLNMGYAGQRMPKIVRRVISKAFRVVGTLPAVLKGRADKGKFYYARSHTALVGFCARRRG